MMPGTGSGRAIRQHEKRRKALRNQLRKIMEGTNREAGIANAKAGVNRPSQNYYFFLAAFFLPAFFFAFFFAAIIVSLKLT